MKTLTTGQRKVSTFYQTKNKTEPQEQGDTFKHSPHFNLHIHGRQFTDDWLLLTFYDTTQEACLIFC